MSAMMAPWLFELITLGVMGLSGISVAVFAGLRQPVIIAGLALGLSSALKTALTFTDWSLGPFHIDTEVWWAVSLALSVSVIIAAVLRRGSHVWQSALIYLGMVAAALTTKYVAGIGERHHSDSANTVALSLLIIQQDQPPESLSNAVKRGLAYPLLLALGPDGRILGGLTPMIFLSTAVLVMGLGMCLLRGHLPTRTVVVSGVLVFVVLWSVPIVRVSMFYLNAHTLTAYATLMVVAGALVVWMEKGFTAGATVAIVAGGMLSTTSRGEGIIFAAIGLALVASVNHRWSVRDRCVFVGVVMVPILSAIWWFETVGASVIDEFGFTPWLLVGAGLLAGVIVATPLIDPIRSWLPWLTVIAMVLYVFGRPALAGNALGPVRSMWNNVVLGYGGWGVLFPLLLAGLVLIGWMGRSQVYRQLALTAVAVVVGAMLAHNLFSSGGFGRDGFYGSLNRMFMQTTGVIALAAFVGLAELLRAALPTFFGSRHDLETPPSYTEAVSLSKVSPQ